MVKKSWLLTLLLCLTWSGWAAAETRFTIRADRKSMALGEPLTVELKVEDVRAALSSIKLDKLEENFNVFGNSSNSLTHAVQGRTVITTTMTLTLYPLRTGKLQLPALSYMGKRSKALTVSVVEFNRQTPRVIFKTAVDISHPLVRQAITLSLDIYDDGSLQWTAPGEITAAGAYQKKLAESQSEEVLDGTRYTLHRHTWSLIPLREGEMTVVLPVLDAFKFGTRLRYALAPLSIKVAPVPAYLPVYVPIGKPLLSLEPLAEKIALNRPINWIFTIQGSGISEEGVSRLLSDIHGNESVRFYPVSISNADNGRPPTAIQSLLVILPFVPLRTGTLQLPEINLPYYDPAGARVDSVSVSGPVVEVFNPVWHSVQMIAVRLLALVAVSGAGYFLFNKLRQVLIRQKSLLAISRAVTADELHQALLGFDNNASLLRSLTLQQWWQRMRMIYNVDDRMHVIVQKLAGARYGAVKSEISISEFSRDAARLLKQCSSRRHCSGNEGYSTLFNTLFQPSARVQKKT